MSRLNKLSIVGYGAADTANSMSISTANMFLLVYYTDVAHLTPAEAGTVLLTVRIFNAFADVLAGRIVDRSPIGRWGKFRPFVAFGFVPLLLSAVTFNVPDLPPAGKVAFVYASYAAACLAYSIVNIPYGCLIGAMTQDARERAKLAGARTVGGLLTGAALGMFVAPLMKAGQENQETFTVLTGLFVVVGGVLYLFTAAVTRERIEQDVGRVTFRQSFAVLKVNHPLLALCVSSVLFVTGTTAMGAAQLFYLRDVLGRLDLYPVVATGQIAITLVLASVMPQIVGSRGKRSVYIAGGSFGVGGGLLTFLAPGDAAWLGVTGIFLGIIGSVTVSIVVWALVADTVEFGQWKTGVRADGTNYALLASTRKLGMAFGGSLPAFALSLGGYSSGAIVQSATAMQSIRSAAGLLPAAIILLSIVVMYQYRLTDGRHSELVAEIRRRANTTRR